MPDAPGSLNFPGALDSAISLIEAANNATGLLSAGIAAGDSTLTLASGGSLFSNTGVLWVDNEAISYTSRTGNVFSGLTRGFENTTPASHSAGATVSQQITARSHTALRDAIIALQTKVGIGADVPAAGDFLRSISPGVSQWSPITSSDVQTAMGYVPVNRAGDTMTGDLALPNFHATGNSQIDGNETVNGTLHVKGAVTLDQILAVAGATNLADVNIAGLLNAKSARFTTRTVTAGYSIQPDDFVLFVNPSVAHVNLNFPSASGQLGRMLVTKRGPYLAPWRWQMIAWSGELLEFGPTIGTVAFRYYDVDWGGHWWVSDGIRWRVISYL